MAGLTDRQKAIIRGGPIDPAILTPIRELYFETVNKLPLKSSFYDIANLAIEGQNGTSYRFNA
jgi:hypothetical protein